MKIRSVVLCVLIALVVVAAEAQVVIDFDDLAAGAVVTNQYPVATFSSDPGFVNMVLDFPGPSSPNILCTGADGGNVNCTAPTYIDFTPAVNGLTFYSVGCQDTGPQAQIVIFENGVQTATVDVVCPMLPYGMIDLSAYSNVTRIELVDIVDSAGIGWDEFTLTPVPVELMSFSIE